MIHGLICCNGVQDSSLYFFQRSSFWVCLGGYGVFQVGEISFCLASWSNQGFMFSFQKFPINWKCPRTDSLAFPMFQEWPTPSSDKLISSTRCLSVRDMGYDRCARKDTGRKITWTVRKITWTVSKMTWAVRKVRSGIKSTGSILWYWIAARLKRIAIPR